MFFFFMFRLLNHMIFLKMFRSLLVCFIRIVKFMYLFLHVCEYMLFMSLFLHTCPIFKEHYTMMNGSLQ